MKPTRLLGLAAAGYLAGAAGSVAAMNVILRIKYKGRGVIPAKETKK